MSTITLQLPDDVAAAVRARAEMSGRSIEQELERWVISKVEAEATLLASILEGREEMKKQGVTTSAEFIREHKREGLQ